MPIESYASCCTWRFFLCLDLHNHVPGHLAEGTVVWSFRAEFRSWMIPKVQSPKYGPIRPIKKDHSQFTSRESFWGWIWSWIIPKVEISHLILIPCQKGPVKQIVANLANESGSWHISSTIPKSSTSILLYAKKCSPKQIWSNSGNLWGICDELCLQSRVEVLEDEVGR